MRARVRSHVETIVVAGVVGLLVAGGPAVAGPLVDFAKRAGNADRVDGLNASRTPRAGQLLALDAKKKFPASVVPAGATGPAGLTGPAGASGPAGPTGPAGATGGPGAKGDAGPAGANGDTGAAGADGAKGDKGDTGAAGSNGTNGADGAPGAKGDKGDPGEKGDKGDIGPAGSAAAYPPIVDVNPILRPSRSHLWDRGQTNGDAWFNGYRSSFPNGTDESYLEWDIPLQAGTWTIDVVYVKSHDAGILSLSLGDDGLGPEIDAYVPSGIEVNQVATFAGVEVATSGIHTLRIETAAKNPASAGYFGYLTWIRLVRE